jgi:radical SAM protein with 4Fe4S-binding SPASM domain
MIAGVRASSLRWYRKDTVGDLAAAGLDYMVLPYLVDEAWHHRICGPDDRQLAAETIARIRGWEMTPVAALPMIPAWTDALPRSLDLLQQLGVHHAEVFAIAELRAPIPGLPTATRGDGTGRTASNGSSARGSPGDRGFYAHELRQFASWIEDLADARRMQLVWLPPHARWQDESLCETLRRGPRAGGDVSIRVDREGFVIPPRGPYRSAGNLLVDPWPDIWHDEAFLRYRGRITSNTRCRQCPGMVICAADCPTEFVSWVLPE